MRQGLRQPAAQGRLAARPDQAGLGGEPDHAVRGGPQHLPASVRAAADAGLQHLEGGLHGGHQQVGADA